MGRELKRVSLTFDWPIDKVWEGFLNPYYAHQIKCPHCENGYSPEYKALERLWYGYDDTFDPRSKGSQPLTPDTPAVRRFAERNVSNSPSYYGHGEGVIRREGERLCAMWNKQWSHHLDERDVAALLKADRLWDFTRVVRPTSRKNVAKWPNGWLKKSNGYIPTPAEVNEWSIGGFGHDSSNCWIVLKAELKRRGQPHECAHCKGAGHTWPDKKTKWRYDHWKPKGPPKGEGYQIWETVSKGSPISPVFATPEELAAHMATTRWGADKGTSYEAWLSFIRGPGWAPSMIGNANGIKSGVEAMHELNS